jgi:hypothetical protein
MGVGNAHRVKDVFAFADIGGPLERASASCAMNLKMNKLAGGGPLDGPTMAAGHTIYDPVCPSPLPEGSYGSSAHGTHTVEKKDIQRVHLTMQHLRSDRPNIRFIGVPVQLELHCR